MTTLYDRVYGCLLGQAIGDAFGAAVGLGAVPQPAITDLIAPPADHPIHGGLQAGEITDDTLCALAILRSILRVGRVEAHDVAQALFDMIQEKDLDAKGLIGPSTRVALQAFINGAAPDEVGRQGWTNGSVMRISVVGLLYPGDLDRTVEAAAEASKPTHNTNVAISAAAAVACAISRAAAGDAGLEDLLEAARYGADEGAHYGHQYICPSIARRIEFAVHLLRGDQPLLVRQRALYDLVGTGLPAYEMAAAALACAVAVDGNPVEAIRLAANTGGDADTTAAIAGAVAGAYAGAAPFPAEWVQRVSEANGLDLAALAAEYTELIERIQAEAKNG